MRIRGAKTEMSELGLDTEGMVESTAKLRSEILALSGVDIMASATEFKSTYQIMDELAQKWEDLTDIQQASVTELIAGKRQGNIVSSLMTNFDTARSALETSLNSTGSAMKEHEKWQESLEAQINKLKASWQGLSHAFLSSDFLHSTLGGLMGLVDVLTNLIDKIGVIPSIVGGFGIFKVISTGIKVGGIEKLADILEVLKLAFPNVTKKVKGLVSSLREISLASGGAGTAFHGFLSLIMQHPYITAAVIAVTALTAALAYQKKKAEELSKEVDELTSKYKEQHGELKNLKGDFDADDESSMVNRYAKLSKGVDNLGRNVSLTADEYSEYQSIVNKIAEQIPSLVSGYDSQGNALLSCKGNVEELTAAYEKLIHAQNQSVLGKSGDIEKNFENINGDKSSYSFWEKLFDWKNISGLSVFMERNTEMDERYIKQIEALLEDPNADIRWFDAYDYEAIEKALQQAGIDESIGWIEGGEGYLRRIAKEYPEELKSVLENYYAEFDEIVTQNKLIAQAKLSEAFDISSAISGVNYDNIGENLQAVARQVVSGLDYEFFDELQEQGKTVGQWTTEMLNQLNAIGKADNTQIEAAFDLQTKFNGGDISYGEYVKNLKDVQSTIDGLNLKDEVKNQLEISLGLDENGIVDQYNALLNRLTSKDIGLDGKVAEKFLNSLSSEELGVLVDIVPKLDAGTTIDEIKSLINEGLAEEFTFSIEVQTEGVEAFNNALAESRSAAGLTSESISALKARYEDLDGFNAAALFEKTANGIHLNTQELSRLEEQYINTNKLDIEKNLNTLVNKYNDLTEEIKDCTDAQEKENLQLQANAYKDKIDELSTLASQYDGLTSAFAKWQTALEGAEEGDNYDSLYENLESIKELYDKGLVGTDKFKTAAQLMTNKDLANADIDEIVNAYKKGYPKMQRYFTEGQKGCKNFLNDVRNLNSEWAHMNKDGSWEINFNAEEVANELGVSVDFVLQIAKKLKDYGFEVNLEDTSVDNLQTKIEKTEAKLKELGQTPYSVNLDATDVKTIDGEIKSLKSHINEVKNDNSISVEVKAAQLEDARAKLEVLIQKKQEASQPAFMNLNTSQVNASLVDALEKVKDYQEALNELNQLQELKSAGIDIDDAEISAAEEKLDGFAKAIQGLDGDVKVAIGLEEDGSIDSIKKAFEEGKVKIDANTDPALTKIEQLAENVERIEDKDVTINVTVNGLDQVKELNRQIDLATDIQGDIDKLSEYVENAKELNKLSDNIVTNITANVKGNVTETPEYELNNLKVFGESAKYVKDIGSFTSKVTADVKGNVIDTPEFKINNLKVFSDSAKDLESIGSPTSVVTAEIKGNVAETAEFKLNNLKVFTDNAKDIGKIGNVESKVVANVDGDVTETAEYKLNNLKVFTDSAEDIGRVGNVESKVVAEIDGNVTETPEFKLNNLKVFSDNSKGLKNIGSFKSEVTAEIKGNVIDEFEFKINNLKVFSDSAKDLESIGNVESNVVANIDGNVIDEFEYKINNLKALTDSAKDLGKIGNVSSNVVANVDGDVTETAEFKLNNLKVFSDSAKDLKSIGSPTSNVTANVDGNVIDTKEIKLDNLEVFANGANKLKNVGSLTSKVTADVLGNVIDTPEYKINNLEIFADDAKKLKGVGSFKSDVAANVSGNVIDEFEFKINNLGVFADNAKNLKEIGDVSSNVTANVDGNITDTFEYKINNLKVFSDSAKDLKNIGTVTSKVTADVAGNVTNTFEESIDNLKVFYDSAKDIGKIGTVKSSVTADVGGNVIDTAEYKINNLKVFSDNAKDVKNVGSPTSNVTANVNGNVINTLEEQIDNLGVFADNANKLKNTGNFTSSVSANVSGNVITYDDVNSKLEHFASIVSGMSNKTVTVNVSANVDSKNINSAIKLLTDVSNSGVFKDYKASVQVGAKIATIDDTTVKNYKAPSKEGKVKYSVDPNSSVYTWTAPNKEGTINYSASVEALTDAQKHKTGTITYKAKISGFPVVNGTANANGSAFANGTSGKAFKQGDWGVKKTTTALTGELGQELVVYRNRFWTVGDNGAEFATIPKGAIVFNHKQTEELFKNGRVTSDGGRGRALVEGTAFVKGGGKFYNSTTGESYGSDSDSSKDFEEILDWIGVIIDRVERSIDKFDQQTNNIYKSWSSRNTALQNQIFEVDREIGLQQQAKSKYKAAANGVGLSSDWAEKVRDGAIDIDTITDEALADKIKSYQKYYEKVLDCEKAIAELTETEASLYAQRVENVSTQYEGILGVIEHEKNILDGYISQSEAQSWLVSGEYYNALASNEKENLGKLKEQREKMLSEMQTAMAAKDDNGNPLIAKGSEAWYEMVADIDAVTEAIQESETTLLEYGQTIQRLSWETFDLLQEKISAVTDESDFLIDLLSNDKLYEDNGQLTNEGMATMGLHGVNYNTYMYQADLAAKEAAKLKKELAKDPYDTELESRYREMIALQQEHILAAEGEKEAIRDMVEEGINLELESLQELIDKKNEALESEKDLYEYQKKVKEQTEEIASLEKQMAAYSGDTSEEAQSKIQELKVSLEEAKTNLQETEYDRYISDQQQLLDDLYLEYEEILNTRLDNLDALVSDMITEINSDASMINTTISEKAESVGYTLSNSMSTIWDTNSTKINNVITTYGDKFANAQTTTNNSLKTINTNLQNMITQLNTLAKTNVKSASISSAAESKKAEPPKTEKPKTDNKKTELAKTIKVGGKINAKGAQIYDYAGDKSGERQLYRNDPIYKVLKTSGNWLQVRWHKLSSGITGWFKKGDVKAYATGAKRIMSDDVAWTQEKGREFVVRPSDGAILTPLAKGDSVLNANASNNIWNMANSPAEFIKDNLNFGAANVPNNSSVQSNYVQNFDKIVFSLPNVKNYDELLSAMQKDKSFEKLITAMTIDRIAGKSSLAKNKSIR